MPPSDSGFSTTTTTNASSRKQSPYNSRCRSTCSIVLSACADLLPSTAEISEDPFIYNTTTNYTFSPEKQQVSLTIFIQI